MIVGKRDVDINELLKHSNSTDEFLEYADSLVPLAFRKVTGIIGNQRYLCCLVFRNSERVSWDRKKQMLPILFSKSKICGYIDCVIEAGDLLDMANLDRVLEYGRKENRDVSSVCKKRKR